MSASSTALATLASKISALEVTVPEWSDGAFRVVFFLSFLGRMVSLLGLVRTLPPSRLIRRSGPSNWGVVVTGSVSIVMVLGWSGGFGFAAVRLVKDRLARFEPALEALSARDLLSPSILFAVDLELPLSPFFTVDASDADSTRLRAVSSDLESDKDFSIGSIAGVVGTLPSATGSSAEAALTPRPIGLGVVEGPAGSLPFSANLAGVPLSALGALVRRFIEVFDIIFSFSVRFMRGWRFVDEGGGDLIRGEVDHDGTVFPDCRLRALSELPSTPFGCKGGLCADKAR